jgi:hypothetical protein
MRTLIAIAALVACSGAWAQRWELSNDVKFSDIPGWACKAERTFGAKKENNYALTNFTDRNEYRMLRWAEVYALVKEHDEDPEFAEYYLDKIKLENLPAERDVRVDFFIRHVSDDPKDRFSWNPCKGSFLRKKSRALDDGTVETMPAYWRFRCFGDAGMNNFSPDIFQFDTRSREFYSALLPVYADGYFEVGTCDPYYD